MTTPTHTPKTVFHTRVRNEALGGANPFEWRQVSGEGFFRGRRIVLSVVPGAFTPACSESHRPGYERHHDAFLRLGVTGLTLHVPPRRINEIVLGKRAFTADTDLRLARYFSMSEAFFLGLQTDYDLMQRRRQIGEELQRINPRAA